MYIESNQTETIENSIKCLNTKINSESSEKKKLKFYFRIKNSLENCAFLCVGVFFGKF